MTEEFDVIVIGSGPGGYVAAIRCAQLGMKTACIEKGPLGGTCLNIGCIPSKTLLHSSEVFSSIKNHSKDYGISVENPTFDFQKMMERKKEVVVGFNQGIGALFKKNKITSIQGSATLEAKDLVIVNEQKLKAKHIILATGSEPMTLPFLPVDEKRIVTSTGALNFSSIPKQMIVIGAGVIGVELGSVYSRLGAEVTFIEYLPMICPTTDPAISKMFQHILEKQKMKFHLNAKVVGAEIGNRLRVSVEKEKQTFSLEADVVLCCIGRRPFTKDLGLEKVGITVNEKGFIPINGRFQTSIPTIYAIGDVVDGPMLAHKASEEGVAVAEIIAGEDPVIEYMAIPNVIYTTPEVASVGMTETEAKAHNLTIKTASFPFSINSRAKCTHQEEGMVKIIVEAHSHILLGVHILGMHASELIAEAVFAIQKKATALDLANTPHAHPTLSEAIKEAALAIYQRAIHR